MNRSGAFAPDFNGREMKFCLTEEFQNFEVTYEHIQKSYL